MKLFLIEFFESLRNNNEFKLILPGHVSDGPATMHRVKTVLSRIEQIVGVSEST